MEKKKNNVLRGVFNIIIYLFAIIGLISVVWLIGTNAGKRMKNVDTMTRSTQSVGFKLEEVGELVTQSAYVTEVIDNQDAKSVKGIKIPFTDKRLLFSYDVKVDASIDFTKITTEMDSEKIVLNVPHAKVFGAETRKDSLKKYIEQGNFSLEDTNEALKEIENRATETAINNGLLEEADKNAETLLKNLIHSEPGFENVEIVINYIEDSNVNNQ